MALIFLNRYFHPDHSATSQMLSDLAFALAAQGRTVHVVTSRQRYDVAGEALPARERVEGVEIHRVWTSRFGRDNLAGRALDYATFYGAAALTLAAIARRGDVVIAKTDPPMLSVVASPVAWLKGARLVNWLQDLFPEIATVSGMGAGRIGRAGFGVLRWLRDRSLQGARLNVAVGQRMAERLAACGVAPERVRVIANWADGEAIRPVAAADNPLRAAWGLGDAFVVGYSGNLGRAHEYETVLEAVARLAAEPVAGGRRIVWLFIGGGALYRQFEAEVTRRGLAGVMFQPYQPREALANSLSAADVHLVSLRPDMEGLVVPSKYYGIAAAGRAAIFIGDSDGEIARLLAADGAGVTVAAGDGAQLAREVRRLAASPELASGMGAAARAAFDRDHARPIALARWQAALDEAART